MQDNPYLPPTTEAPFAGDAAASHGEELATRGSRLAAAMLDGVIVLAVIAPVQWALGVYDDYTAYSQNTPAQVAWGLAGLAVTVALNGYLLATRAQSIGKVALGIKIVTLDGHNADLKRIVLRRMLPITAASIVPVVGGFAALLDALFIFRSDRRTLHDQIAGTRVVRA